MRNTAAAAAARLTMRVATRGLRTLTSEDGKETGVDIDSTLLIV
jgi:hypothetical protein